jgi:hypothetical protein
LCVAIVVAACAGPPNGSSTPAAPSSSAAQGSAYPVRAEASDGPFQLVFELPAATWQAGQPIDGRASLGIATGGADVGGSGSGLVGFEFREVGGHLQVGPAWTSDCRQYHLDAGAPLVTEIVKSGGFAAEDPDAAFYRSFFADPLVRLPAGTWEIAAVADFTEGGACDGAQHTMQAPITVTITP